MTPAKNRLFGPWVSQVLEGREATPRAVRRAEQAGEARRTRPSRLCRRRDRRRHRRCRRRARRYRARLADAAHARGLRGRRGPKLAANHRPALCSRAPTRAGTCRRTRARPRRAWARAPARHEGGHCDPARAESNRGSSRRRTGTPPARPARSTWRCRHRRGRLRRRRGRRTLSLAPRSERTLGGDPLALEGPRSRSAHRPDSRRRIDDQPGRGATATWAPGG